MTEERKVWPGICAKVCASLLMLGVAVAPARAQPPGQQAPFLGQLHSDLQLNPSQEDAWNTFQQAYRVDPQEMARERDADSRMPGMTGPERMDLAIRMAEQNLGGLRRRGDALRAFYATLSPQQQKTFDRDTLPPR